jgi:hypothetical protein
MDLGIYKPINVDAAHLREPHISEQLEAALRNPVFLAPYWNISE